MKTESHLELHIDRYVFDFGRCTASKGFAQIDTDQDAPHFGAWTNPFKLITILYIEGDVTTKQAETEKEYIADLCSNHAWNVDEGYGMSIDPLCNDKLIARFRELRLDDLFHGYDEAQMVDKEARMVNIVTDGLGGLGQQSKEGVCCGHCVFNNDKKCDITGLAITSPDSGALCPNFHERDQA